jgi:hypothetical protein
MRQIREREYHKLLEFVLQLILTAVPESLMQRDTSLQEIIQVFLNFFEVGCLGGIDLNETKIFISFFHYVVLFESMPIRRR